MSKITNLLALAAIGIFEAHNAIDEIYITADGQGFTDEEKAKDHARYHKDQTIKHFERGFEAGYQKEAESIEKLKAKIASAVGDKFTVLEKDDTERQNLVEQYTELFGNKPNHMMGIEKLKTKIADKKAELEAAKKVEVPVVEDVKKSSEEETVNK